MNKCKNCGKEKFDIKTRICGTSWDYCRCDKQFIPQENQICKHGKEFYCVKCYKENKGYGKLLSQSREFGKIYCCKENLYPSCLKTAQDSSNHSLAEKGDHGIPSEDEDSDSRITNSSAEQGKPTDSGSDFILSDSKFMSFGVEAYYGKGVKEFIQRVDKIIRNHKWSRMRMIEEINKLAYRKGHEGSLNG